MEDIGLEKRIFRIRDLHVLGGGSQRVSFGANHSTLHMPPRMYVTTPVHAWTLPWLSNWMLTKLPMSAHSKRRRSSVFEISGASLINPVSATRCTLNSGSVGGKGWGPFTPMYLIVALPALVAITSPVHTSATSLALEDHKSSTCMRGFIRRTRPARANGRNVLRRHHGPDAFFTRNTNVCVCASAGAEKNPLGGVSAPPDRSKALRSLVLVLGSLVLNFFFSDLIK